jgi:HAD superfamily hydrolase (TIGR01509 family)
VHAVIFDMDGVLLDSELLHKKAEKRTFAPYGVKLTDEELTVFTGQSSRSLLNAVREKNRIDTDVESLYASLQIHLMDIFAKEAEAIAGAVPLVHELVKRDVPLAVASSSPLQLIKLSLGRIGLESFFPVVVSGDEVKKSKPNPDIFLEAARRLSVPPDRCAVIEDSSSGVAGAKAAGMFTVGFRSPNSLHQNVSTADLVIDDLGPKLADTFQKVFESGQP